MHVQKYPYASDVAFDVEPFECKQNVIWIQQKLTCLDADTFLPNTAPHKGDAYLRSAPFQVSTLRDSIGKIIYSRCMQLTWIFICL